MPCKVACLGTLAMAERMTCFSESEYIDRAQLHHFDEFYRIYEKKSIWCEKQISFLEYLKIFIRAWKEFWKKQFYRQNNFEIENILSMVLFIA